MPVLRRLVLSTLFALVVSAAMASPASATTYTWTGVDTEYWSNPSNWSPSGVPGGADDVVVPMFYVGANELTDPGTFSVNSIDIADGANVGNLTVATLTKVQPGGLISINNLTTAEADIDGILGVDVFRKSNPIGPVTGDGTIYLSDGSIGVAGMTQNTVLDVNVNQDGFAVTIATDNTVTLGAGHTWNMGDGGSLTGGATERFVVNGTLWMGTSTLAATLPWSLGSPGTVAVSANRSVTLHGDVPESYDGRFYVGANSNLNLAGPHMDLHDANFDGDATGTINSTSDVVLSGVTTLDHALNITGGNFSYTIGAGFDGSHKTINWTGGAWDDGSFGTGIVIPNGMTVNVSGATVSNAVFYNSGTFNFTNANVTGSAEFYNNGTLTTGGANASSAVDLNVIENDGTVSATDGALVVTSGFVIGYDAPTHLLSEGTWATSGTGTLTLPFDVTNTLQGTAAFSRLGGPLKVSDNSAAISGVTAMHDTAAIDVDGTGVIPDLALDENAHATFRSGSTVSVDSITASAGSTVDAAGSMDLSGGGLVIVNGGTVNVPSGGQITGAMGEVHVNAGTFAGTGNINVNVMQSGGAISPGGAGIGTLTMLNHLTQTGGELAMQLNTTGSGDFLIVLGTATLDGTFHVLAGPYAGNEVLGNLFTLVDTGVLNDTTTKSFDALTTPYVTRMWAGASDKLEVKIGESRAPTAPGAVTSSSHASPSKDRTIDVSWGAATDPAPTSGVDGYSYVIDESSATVPNATKDVEETTTSLTTATLNDGNYFVHVIALDGEGNPGPVRHGGPFVVSQRVATDGPDTFLGTGGADVWRGMGGDDRFTSGEGDDRIFGGAGNDAGNAGLGADTVYGEAGNDLLRGNEGNDSLHGGVDNDRLYGNAGNDWLYGDSGADWLWGGPGNDYLAGGRGPDHLAGGPDADTLRGGPGGDTVSGNGGRDNINPGTGRDTVNAGTGDDTLTTVDNAVDIVNCGSGIDHILADKKDILHNCDIVALT